MRTLIMDEAMSFWTRAVTKAFVMGAVFFGPALYSDVYAHGGDHTYSSFQEDFREYRSPFQEIREDQNLFFTGYIKTDVFADSRQVVAARDGHFLIVPRAKSLDANRCDINANGQTNILAIETRGRVTGRAPDIAGAQALGMVEADFFGRANDTINSLRMYFACANLNWDDTVELLFGQYWHPILVEDCMPDRVGFGTAAPYEAHPRSPQVRLTYHYENTEFIAAVMSDLDFVSVGPRAFNDDVVVENTAFLRNAMRPIMHLQVKHHVNEHVVGAGIDIRTIQPRIETEKNRVTSASLTSLAGIAYAKFQGDGWSAKAKLICGENLAGYRMFGGYGVGSVNTVTGERCYENLRTLSFWLDIAGGNEIQPGVFVGYSKNLGARHTLATGNIFLVPGKAPTAGPVVYTFLDLKNLDYAARISPRIKWFTGSVEWAAEVDYNVVAYGTLNACGRVDNACPVHHLRLLLAAYYLF